MSDKDKKPEEQVEDLDQCTSAPHPEMSRNVDEDEPCDDNRANE